MSWLRRPRLPVIPAGMLGGFVTGAWTFWILTTREWPLSFWTTLQAAGDAETYGHPIEHFAESLLVGMLFIGAAGAAVGAFAGWALLRRRLL